MQSQYLRLAPTALAVLDLVLFDHEPHWLITRINVPERFRGLGHGTALLVRATRVADATAKILWLAPASSGSIPNRTLRQWYKRHGFENHPDGVMFRMPYNLTTNTGATICHPTTGAPPKASPES